MLQRFRKPRTREYKSWHGVLFLAVVFISLVLGFVQRNGEPTVPVAQDVFLTELTCTVAGGVWDACGSPCRAMGEDEFCVEVCMAMCECTSDSQCPYGYTCDQFVNDVGICL